VPVDQRRRRKNATCAFEIGFGRSGHGRHTTSEQENGKDPSHQEESGKSMLLLTQL